MMAFLAAAGSSPKGTSVGMPLRSQKRRQSRSFSRREAVAQGLIAPPLRVRRGAGVTRARASSITPPKPRPARQAADGGVEGEKPRGGRGEDPPPPPPRG